MEAFVLYQDVLELTHRAADGRLVDAVGFADVFLGAVLAPVHQHHQEPVFQTRRWRVAQGGQVGLKHLHHQGEPLFGDAGEPFELVRGIVVKVSIEHDFTMTQPCATFELTYFSFR